MNQRGKQSIMKIDKLLKDDVLILDIEGEIDAINSHKLQDVINDAIQEHIVKIIIDMSNLIFINSIGLALLTDMIKILRDSNGDLKFVNLHPNIEKIFKLTGLERYFDIYATVPEALESFSK